MSLPAFALSQPERLYIGGRWLTPKGGGRISVTSPHNECGLVTLAQAGEADVAMNAGSATSKVA
jgi:hypothetical protein